MKTIQLTRGFVTTVDDSDYEELIQRKWFASTRLQHVYAARGSAREPGVSRRTILMHRVLLGIDGRRDLVTDHMDGNTLNNQRSNLRLATTAQNVANQKIHAGVKSSRFKGVSWHKGEGRWRAVITKDRRKHCLGYFDDEGVAAEAYNVAAVRLFGEFARLNLHPTRRPR